VAINQNLCILQLVQGDAPEPKIEKSQLLRLGEIAAKMDQFSSMFDWYIEQVACKSH